MNRLLLVSLAALVLGMGCKPATDLNKRCVLVKRNPDGGTPLNLREGEVRNAQGQNKDFIAVGTLDCEDLVCVRDSFFTSDASADAPAEGYCSRACVLDKPCPSYDEALDKGPTALTCRALLLSPETLAALARGDGGFAGIYDPNFCARGTGGDGGT